MANFKDGVIRDGNSLGSGQALGNIKDGIIRNGSSKGAGSSLGNIKDGIIRDGSSKGAGKAILNVKGIQFVMVLPLEQAKLSEKLAISQSRAWNVS